MGGAVTPHARTRTPDLHLDLDLRHRRGRSDELVAALRRAIESGKLLPGTRLPSTRSAAADFGIARGTVVNAYYHLIAEGYLETAPGSGTRVARPAPEPPGEDPGPASRPSTWRYNLMPGAPDMTLFPRAAWVKATQRVLNTTPAEALGYGDPRGRPELRRALADYLGRSRGVVTRPDRIIICHGFTQALGLIAAVLVKQGVDTVSVEDPGYPHFREVIRLAGLSTHAVEVDEHGLRPEGLSGGAAVVTPIHQYPSGVPLSAERRRALVSWAETSDAVIVEDDYDGEFQYGTVKVGALQATAPHRVIYAGTTSKTLAPGIRLAWLVVPADWVERITDAKRIADHHSAALTQMIVTELLLTGAYDQHIRRCRDHYRMRRDRLAAILAEHAPTAWVMSQDRGLHALIRWPADGPSEREVLRAARAESLALAGLGSYWTAPEGHPPGLVIGFATPPHHAYGAALAALARVLDRCFGR